MIAKLIEYGVNPSERREIPITKEEFLIGRGPDCDLRLGVSDVSRHHCMVRLRGDEAAVVDLGSINGTYLNGQRIRSQAPLHSGDELQVGPFYFHLQIGSQDGISWYAEPGTDPAATTLRLKDVKQLGEQPGQETDRGHPPGEARSPEDSTGQESG